MLNHCKHSIFGRNVQELEKVQTTATYGVMIHRPPYMTTLYCTLLCDICLVHEKEK